MTVETKGADFVISRVFDAPRDLVWQCFTDPERMKEWWGPKGSTIVASNMDFRVGGIYLGAMRDPGGNVMWGKFVYREITPPQQFKFNEALSFQVMCESQDEIDRFWSKLSDGGQEGPCGWLKDKYGLSWQIVPSTLPQMISQSNGATRDRVMAAVMKMKKVASRRSSSLKRINPHVEGGPPRRWKSKNGDPPQPLLRGIDWRHGRA